MKKKAENKTTKPAVKYPLYKIGRNGNNEWLWIIARTAGDALAKAQIIWTRKKLDAPKSVSIEFSGTVDYIPALRKPNWES